jgi:hypothetical protein
MAIGELWWLSAIAGGRAKAHVTYVTITAKQYWLKISWLY